MSVQDQEVSNTPETDPQDSGAISDSANPETMETDLNGAHTAVGVPHPENRHPQHYHLPKGVKLPELDDYDDDRAGVEERPVHLKRADADSSDLRLERLPDSPEEAGSAMVGDGESTEKVPPRDLQKPSQALRDNQENQPRQFKNSD